MPVPVVVRAFAASAPRRTRCLPGLLLLLALGTVDAAATDGIERRADSFDQEAALQASQAAIGRVLRDRELVDQDGKPLPLSAFRGRPLVLSMVFTHCTYACSSQTVHLREVVKVARDALGDDRFSVLTVGFDSPRDTPERMRAFARERGIDDPRWHFASGDAATVRRLTDEIGFTWTESSAGFDHITQLTLLDAEGRVTRQIYGTDFAPPDLVEPLKQLVLEQSAGSSPVRGLIDGARLFCTVYDPVSGSYRFDFGLLLGSLPVAIVLLAVVLAIGFATRRES
jgi:protein SCO1/2